MFPVGLAALSVLGETAHIWETQLCRDVGGSPRGYVPDIRQEPAEGAISLFDLADVATVRGGLVVVEEVYRHPAMVSNSRPLPLSVRFRSIVPPTPYLCSNSSESATVATWFGLPRKTFTSFPLLFLVLFLFLGGGTRLAGEVLRRCRR